MNCAGNETDRYGSTLPANKSFTPIIVKIERELREENSDTPTKDEKNNTRISGNIYQHRLTPKDFDPL